MMNKRERFQQWLRATVYRARATAAVWRNPVVVRDIRVRLRGSRAFWHIAFYLALLGVLALAGYADATRGGSLPSASASQIQGSLQSLYTFIFMTLASLVCFIAPALTAASVTTERQRLTLDLLVTTPLSSSELLVGKMISSMAFLALLLVLSLPASALCVVLGGATMGDIFRAYALLLVDGLVLSAIGLYYSATSKDSKTAIISTYVSVGMVLWFSSPILMFGGATGGGHAMAGAAMAVGALNPFFAVTFPGGTFDLVGLHIPLWILTVAAAFLLIRLLITGATYRMGSYGTDALGSLRRQILFLTGLGAFFIAYGMTYGTGSAGTGTMVVSPIGARSLDAALFEYLMIAAAAFAMLFFPSLFTPQAPEDAPPGAAVDGTYDPRRAFQPAHAGALPFYHLWLGILTLGLVAGMAIGGPIQRDIAERVLMTALYLSALGYLAWCLARRISTIVAGISGARAITFGAQVLLVAAPILLIVLFKQFDNAPDSVFAPLWIFYPLMKPEPNEATDALFRSTVLCYGVGTLIWPFWRKVVPAGFRYWGVAVEAG